MMMMMMMMWLLLMTMMLLLMMQLVMMSSVNPACQPARGVGGGRWWVVLSNQSRAMNGCHHSRPSEGETVLLAP